MKILEAESGRLTNYEVFRHLTEQKARHMAQGRRGPPNLETVVREVSAHMAIFKRSEQQAHPLGDPILQYGPEPFGTATFAVHARKYC